MTDRTIEPSPEGLGAHGDAAIRRWVRGCADDITANREFLTQLDAAIGDADHGINMDRGFSAAVTDLDATGDLPAGELLIRVGGTLIYRVGGAAGPLFGTCLRRAGESLGEAETFDAEDLLAALRAGLEGIQKLGAAGEGDKTIVDAYAPGLVALERDLRAGGDIVSASREAARAARDGMRATVPMQARKGRASYLGSRSVGHQDPGATSTAYLFGALARALDGDR
ncbi:MAG TPA: dihydroxyacetone kinase subunit DhaL [Actinomycetota bacterium]|nr:dihydroxyacetone kinase subunit DhaL [Actinomycetota bacterium]